MAVSKPNLLFPYGFKLEFMTLTPTEHIKQRKESGLKKLKYYLFCIRWLWKNTEWVGTRQKYKALEKAYAKHLLEITRRTK